MASPRINNGAYLGETIRTWTCKWSHADGREQKESAQTLTKFHSLCAETRASYALMLALIGLEVLFGAVAGISWWLERGIERKRTAFADTKRNGDVM